MTTSTDGRLAVAKTYKLYVGGAFPRSESGRSYPVTDQKGRLLAHAALASRKDVRDAVSAARSAGAGWAGATGYNRGQVLYRVAEMLQARHDQFTDDVVAAEGATRKRATAVVDATIDRWVWYAGWTDKITSVLGSVNSVAGPYLNWSAPEPTGVVGVLAPQSSSLLGLVDVLAPVLATGCTAVVVASQERPLPAIGLAEVLATSDLPGGVANLLTGSATELGPRLAAHAEVQALDLAGAPEELAAELERAAAGTVKRVLPRPATEADHTRVPGIERLRAYTEIKTVWHPVGR
ncbi:aldehyde dehydrogenase family protein [Pseudonocardia sp. GCM10023141]|uniref:aldehyde dehydrogenase family protein n=1 Tax=Pseudonocardia sp. GCM10023141 TaxID=3252653 RepID=UPI00361EF670